MGEFGITFMSVRMSVFCHGFCAGVKCMHYSGQKAEEKAKIWF